MPQVVITLFSDLVSFIFSLNLYRCCCCCFFFLQEFVDGLEVQERRRLLILVLNNGRGSLDYARRLLNNEDPQPQPDPENNVPRWCICGNCLLMPTPDENKCCERRECITSYELFHNLCIDRHVLELAIRARCDIRVEPLDFSMASFRKAMAKLIIVFTDGNQLMRFM